MNDLIERLRDERKLGNRPVTKGRLIAEAADEIERLTADRDEWVRLWKNASNGVLSLQARVEALEGELLLMDETIRNSLKYVGLAAAEDKPEYIEHPNGERIQVLPKPCPACKVLPATEQEDD